MYNSRKILEGDTKNFLKWLVFHWNKSDIIRYGDHNFLLYIDQAEYTVVVRGCLKSVSYLKISKTNIL